MGRPPLDVGTYGKIRFSPTSTGYRARASFRGYDGKVREIERTGATEAKAERALKQAIKDALQTPSGGDITAKTYFRDVATAWLTWQEKRVATGKRAEGTLGNYRSMLNNRVLPALGDLRLFEVTVSRLDGLFPSIQADTSAAHARTARAVVSGILRFAVRHDAMDRNLTREIEPIEGGSKKKVRALTQIERREWIALLTSDEDARRHDLPDLVRFMLATGVRIGEALALYWEDVDLAAGVVLIDWTVVRVKGKGLRRTDPKSRASERTLGLTPSTVEMLRRRHKAAVAEHRPAASPVFPDSLGGLRDPSNTRRSIREARGGTQFEWVTSHVFRKTAATILDDAKVTARVIADQLGHSKPSMTQDNYMGRTVISPEVAAALEIALAEDDQGNSGGKPGK